MDRIDCLFKKDFILLDGGLGTELLRRNIPTPLPLWSAEAIITSPESIAEIHKDYLLAGAEIITTNTFRTNRRVINQKYPISMVEELTLKACELATSARDQYNPAALVAGCMAPVEDCYHPELVPEEEILLKEHQSMIDIFQKSGVDFIAGETFNCLSEARVVAKLANQSGMPFGISLVCNQQGDLLSGEDLLTVAKELESYNPLYLGINCCSPQAMAKPLQDLVANLTTPVAVYANGAGEPHDQQGWIFESDQASSVKSYSEQAMLWKSMGAKIIGGCCGTTPAYIEDLRNQLKSTPKPEDSTVGSRCC